MEFLYLMSYRSSLQSYPIYPVNTGLPTEDETSETIEKNLLSRFACIYDSLQMKTCFSFRELLKKPQKKFMAKYLI